MDKLVVKGYERVFENAAAPCDDGFGWFGWCPRFPTILPYKLAVAARKSIASAIVCGAGSCSAIKAMYYEGAYRSTGKHVSRVLKDTVDIERAWDWAGEKDTWNDHFPNVQSIFFGGLEEFVSTPRLCGLSIGGLKMVTLSFVRRDEEFSYGLPDAVALEFARLQTVETLVLKGLTREDDLVQLNIPVVVEVLPRLRNLVPADFSNHMSAEHMQNVLLF